MKTVLIKSVETVGFPESMEFVRCAKAPKPQVNPHNFGESPTNLSIKTVDCKTFEISSDGFERYRVAFSPEVVDSLLKTTLQAFANTQESLRKQNVVAQSQLTHAFYKQNELIDRNVQLTDKIEASNNEYRTLANRFAQYKEENPDYYTIKEAVSHYRNENRELRRSNQELVRQNKMGGAAIETIHRSRDALKEELLELQEKYDKLVKSSGEDFIARLRAEEKVRDMKEVLHDDI